VGPAWMLVREKRPELELYISDGSHPSAAGSYLAACTFYATLFRASPVGLPARVSGTPVNLDTEELEVGKTAVLVELSQEDARFLQEAAWSAVQTLERLPAEPDVGPQRFELPALPEGAPLTELALAGEWKGSFVFSPTGPAKLTLDLDPPAADTAAWSGHVEIEFHSKDVHDVALDLTDLSLIDGKLSFSVPKALLEMDIHFQAVLLATGELTGHAESNREEEDASMRFLGSWTLHRSD